MDIRNSELSFTASECVLSSFLLTLQQKANNFPRESFQMTDSKALCGDFRFCLSVQNKTKGQKHILKMF